MRQLVDWNLRTGPARALELCEQREYAQRLRDLPEVLWDETAHRPGLLRKYTSTLRAGYEQLRGVADARSPDGAAAGLAAGAPPGGRPLDLTELVRTISFDVRTVLAGSHAGSWARQIFDEGLIFSSCATDFSDLDYVRELDVDLRIALCLHVDKAVWVSAPPPGQPNTRHPFRLGETR